MHFETFLAREAYIAGQPEAVKQTIEALCYRTNLTLRELINPETSQQQNVRNSLVCRLGNMGLTLRNISAITDVTRKEALLLLNRRRERETRIRTTNWRRAA